MLRILCLFGIHFRQEDRDSPNMICKTCGHKKPLWNEGSKPKRTAR
ncbi:hypothetical protein Z947_2451 [Sulfitobacter geojensis]|nr:hypothetical protein Z947_2451 [Sulfitobacter geojensis]